MGGMVLETNMSEILTHVEAQNKLEKSESSPTSTIKVYIIIYPLLLKHNRTSAGNVRYTSFPAIPRGYSCHTPCAYLRPAEPRLRNKIIKYS